MAAISTLVAEIDTIVKRFPDDLQLPMRDFTVWMLEELQVSHKDFTELKDTVQRLATSQELTKRHITDLTIQVEQLAVGQEKLAAAQQRTEERVEQLAAGQEKLAAAQERTEERVEQLAAAQERTEERVEQLAAGQEKLAAAQERTEERVEQLAAAQERTEERVEQLAAGQEKLAAGQERLAAAQERTEQELQRMGKSLSDQISSLGSRWGIYNEGTFRSTIYGVLREVDGVTVKEGFYGGRQVDIVIRNGEHILLEITSRMHARDIDRLYQSAKDYEAQEGMAPKLMVATSYVSPKLMQKIMGLPRPIEIFSYEGEE